MRQRIAKQKEVQLLLLLSILNRLIAVGALTLYRIRIIMYD